MWPKSDKCDGFVETGNIICEKNLTYWLLKLIWPTSETCYGLNYDAKVLCNNSSVIDSFKIDDLPLFTFPKIPMCSLKDFNAFIILCFQN